MTYSEAKPGVSEIKPLPVDPKVAVAEAVQASHEELTNAAGDRPVPELGTTLVLPETDGEKDESMENISPSEQLKRVLEMVQKALESGLNLSEARYAIVGDIAQMDELKDDIALHFNDFYEDIASDPYAKHILLQFFSLPEEEMGIVEKISAREPLTEENKVALLNILDEKIHLDALDPTAIFYIAYLKVCFASMNSKQTAGLLEGLHPENLGHYMAKMKTLGLIDDNAIHTYTTSLNIEHASDLREQIRFESVFMTDQIVSNPGMEVSYKLNPVDTPQTDMDKKYLLSNVPAKSLAFFVGFMTFLLNAGGAVRLLIKEQYKEAFDHVVKHPWLPVSAGTMYGMYKALSDPTRPLPDLMRSAMDSESMKLMSKGVNVPELYVFTEPKAYEEIDAILSTKANEDLTADDRSKLRATVTRSLEAKPIGSRKITDETIEGVITLYRHLAKNNYSNAVQARNFCLDTIKKYHKMEKALKYEAREASEAMTEESPNTQTVSDNPEWL